jgi:hypothetical protein
MSGSLESNFSQDPPEQVKKATAELKTEARGDKRTNQRKKPHAYTRKALISWRRRTELNWRHGDFQNEATPFNGFSIYLLFAHYLLK